MLIKEVMAIQIFFDYKRDSITLQKYLQPGRSPVFKFSYILQKLSIFIKRAQEVSDRIKRIFTKNKTFLTNSKKNMAVKLTPITADTV